MSAAPFLFFILLGLLAAWVVGYVAFPVYDGLVLVWDLTGPDEWRAEMTHRLCYKVMRHEGLWYAYCVEGTRYKFIRILDEKGCESPSDAKQVCQLHWMGGKEGEAL